MSETNLDLAENGDIVEKISDEESVTESPKKVKKQAAPKVEEPTFSVEELQRYSQQLFGVGPHVLVGARSAGCFPKSDMTRERARTGIKRYLEMPVQSKET